MKKKLFIATACVLLGCLACVYGGFSKCASNESALILENAEALTNGESVVVVNCEGNVGTCAKGVDSNTGHEFIIHGKANIVN